MVTAVETPLGHGYSCIDWTTEILFLAVGWTPRLWKILFRVSGFTRQYWLTRLCLNHHVRWLFFFSALLSVSKSSWFWATKFDCVEGTWGSWTSLNCQTSYLSEQKKKFLFLLWCDANYVHVGLGSVFSCSPSEPQQRLFSPCCQQPHVSAAGISAGPVPLQCCRHVLRRVASGKGLVQTTQEVLLPQVWVAQKMRQCSNEWYCSPWYCWSFPQVTSEKSFACLVPIRIPK